MVPPHQSARPQIALDMHDDVVEAHMGWPVERRHCGRLAVSGFHIRDEDCGQEMAGATALRFQQEIGIERTDQLLD